MSVDGELQDMLRRLAGAVPREASAAAERKLRATFRARQAPVKSLWSYVAEVAAMLAALAGLYLALTHGRSAEQRAAIATPVDLAPEFIALPYAQSGVPMEQPVIVRVKISVSELGGMGVPVAAFSRSGSVSAELLVGQDGVARAVRLIE